MNKVLHKSLACLVLALAGCDSSMQASEGSKASATDWKPQWGAPDSALLRPGSMIETGSSGCTAGFLFVDPVKQLYYMGTAAHCASGGASDDGTGQRVAVETAIGTVVTIPESRQEIGTVVFDSDSPDLQQNFGVDGGVDFALVLLDPGLNEKSHPQVISMNAPTGFIDCADTASGDRFSFHGHGMVFGGADATRTRPGVLVVCDGNNYAGYTAAIFGDSGGPAVHDANGLALGFISGAGLDTTPPTELIGPTLPYVLRELSKAGFGNVALATVEGGFVGL